MQQTKYILTPYLLLNVQKFEHKIRISLYAQKSHFNIYRSIC